jgi:hypothetical protein
MATYSPGQPGVATVRSGKNSVPFPVRYAGFEFDILGFKRFKLRREGSSKGWMYVNDCGSFFQTSLLNAIDPAKWDTPILSAEEYQVLADGKSRRSSAVLDDTMRAYNRLENDIFGRLMRELSNGFASCGVRLQRSQWFGPGQAAQYWLSHLVDCPDTDTVGAACPDQFLTAARYSYYGGWFEIFAHGHIPGASYEYDINSAYPHVTAGLPCLVHGTWSSRYPVGRDISIVHAHVRGNDEICGAMLHRMPDGSIRRPNVTTGYYWQTELDAARRSNILSECDVIERWTYEPCDCPSPLASLSELYNLRLSVGKNSSMGKALKLLYNSVYGKFAQSVGNPRFGNPVYASLITSGCRTAILDAIATHPAKTRDLLMVATDGVYFRTPHPTLPISEKLGEWDVQTKVNLTLFKPGVYWDDAARKRIRSGDAPNFKARGISAHAFAKCIAAIDDQFSGWPERYPAERDPLGKDRTGWFPRVCFDTTFAMVTATQAIAWNAWSECGRVGHADVHPSGCAGCTGAHVVQDSDPIGKRHSGSLVGDVYRSSPYADGGTSPESVPYERRFGLEEYGVTEDGDVISEFAWFLLDN